MQHGGNLQNGLQLQPSTLLSPFKAQCRSAMLFWWVLWVAVAVAAMSWSPECWGQRPERQQSAGRPGKRQRGTQQSTASQALFNHLQATGREAGGMKQDGSNSHSTAGSRSLQRPRIAREAAPPEKAGQREAQLPHGSATGLCRSMISKTPKPVTAETSCSRLGDF